MKILAIETSTEACSAAIGIGDTVIHRFELAPRRHTELILPMIDELMSEAGLHLVQLDLLAYGRGPGAFTGIRIGTGLVQGMALASDLPVAQISTLAAMAQGCWREKHSRKILSLIDARMNEVYWGYFLREDGGMKRVLEEGICKPDEVPLVDGDWTVTASGWKNHAPILEQHLADFVNSIEPDRYPNAMDIVPLAKQQFDQGEIVSADRISPVYLRDQVTS